ncbi:hypothetical protein QR685DRAFT_561492 [Neurospora intermedia]|uniref:Uncharacterized protein n=1 Tax=Neurospora intermedia TaxID=5142 RepID=A0ABR3DGH7_NEUIN
MFITRALLGLALAVAFPPTIAAQFTTSLLTPNTTKPTIQLRNQNGTASALPSSSKTFQSSTTDIVVARDVEDPDKISPTWIGKACPGAQKHNLEVPEDWAWARAFESKVNIWYLQGVPGMPKNGKGPRNCGRVACRGDSAVYWCNNDPGQERELPGYGWIAEGADALWRDARCWRDPNTFAFEREGRIRGEIYSDETWSVFIRGEDCLKPGKTS